MADRLPRLLLSAILTALGATGVLTPTAAGADQVAKTTVSVAALPDGSGYYVVRSDGAISYKGAAIGYGSNSGLPNLNKPIPASAITPTGAGVYLLGGDGGVFAYGDARFYGSTGSIKLNQPANGMAATKTGNGYWFVASDGGIFAYGDAAFYGSMGGKPLNKPVVGMAPTPDGHGYWLVASDGGIFAYGDAAFYGSLGGASPSAPIVAINSSASGHGYWQVGADGRVYNYGDAPSYGNATYGNPDVFVDPTITSTGAVSCTRANSTTWIMTWDVTMSGGSQWKPYDGNGGGYLTAQGGGRWRASTPIYSSPSAPNNIVYVFSDVSVISQVSGAYDTLNFANGMGIPFQTGINCP